MNWYKNKRSNLIALFWINPWVGLGVVTLMSESIRYKAIDAIFATFVLSIGIASSIHTENIIAIVNWFLLAIYMVLLKNWSYHSPSLVLPSIYVLIGIFFGFIFSVQLTERVGLFGGEPNFTGFVVLMYFSICLHRGVRYILLIPIFGAVMLISGSRAFLICTTLLMVYYFFRENKLYIYIIFTCFSILFIFADSLFILFDNLIIFQRSSYIESSDRILAFNDPSTIERLMLNYEWIDRLTVNYWDFFLGIPNSEYLNLQENIIGKIPHNSYIQKAAEFGAMYVILFIIFAVKRLPLWIAVSIMTYSLFLHNLLSLPWIVVLALYTHNDEHQIAAISLFNSSSLLKPQKPSLISDSRG